MRKTGWFVVILLLALSIAAYAFNFQVGYIYGQEAGLVAKYVEGPIPLTAPEDILWDDVKPFELSLSPQLTSTPWTHPEPSVRSLTVKVVHNGTWISFLLTWQDPTEDLVTRPDTFRDAAAIMLALQPGAGQCMGTPTAEVVIAHWKADWQRDVEVSFADIPDLYPNAWSDWYVAVVGAPPYTLPEVYAGEARAFVGGWAAGNPLSNPYKLTPVETLVAQGFGTLTTYQYQSFIGWGVHKADRWRVVISRPLVTGRADPPWDSSVEVAFAVWDGSKGEVGPKKGVSTPVMLTLERPEIVTGPPIWPMVVVAVVVFVVTVLLMGLGRRLLRLWRSWGGEGGQG